MSAVSNLDAVRVMFDIITIDVSSAASVLAGFTCTHTYKMSQVPPPTSHSLFVFFLGRHVVSNCVVLLLWRFV